MTFNASSAEPVRQSTAVIGAGSIGTAWAIVFATAGLPVRLHDADPARLKAAAAIIAGRLAELARHGLIDEAPDDVAARIVNHPALGAAVAGAAYIQECAPESLELKQALFAELDRLAAGDAVLASSSSFLPASRFARGRPAHGLWCPWCP